ncbi:MAG: response regulator, partial [Terriglobia bacterium]
MKKRTRILIADDHSIVRRGVRALLESERKWQVCGEASTGQEAVGKAQSLKPDVIVLDVAMPDINGLSATRQILKNVPSARVLILSMHESEQAVHDALEAGARGYVFKSDLDRDLLTAVEMLSQDKSFFTPKVSEMVLGGYLKGGSGEAESKPARRALTPRQREVVRLLAEGKTNKEVASLLAISVKTAEAHRSAIMNRLKLDSFSEL